MCAKRDIQYSLIEAEQRVATMQRERVMPAGSSAGNALGGLSGGLGSNGSVGSNSASSVGSVGSGVGSSVGSVGSVGSSVGNSDVVFVAKSMTLREDQYTDITSLAAYNKLLRKKPDTVSAVVREALDQYLSVTDDSYRYIGK